MGGLAESGRAPSARLLRGDCLELMDSIPDGSVDMVLCDLPYGTTRNAWDSPVPLGRLWEQYARVCKEDAAILLFSQMPFTVTLVNSNPGMFRYQIVWKKTRLGQFLNARRRPLAAHEEVNLFSRGGATYNPQMRQGKPYVKVHSTNGDGRNYGSFERRGTVSENHGERYPIDVVEFASVGRPRHPTQKPVPLLEYLVRTYSNPGETVLDSCMGSGSTGIACLDCGRNFIGIELDGGYFESASEWIGSWMGGGSRDD